MHKFHRSILLLAVCSLSVAGAEFPWLSFDNRHLFEVAGKKARVDSRGGMRISWTGSPVQISERAFRIRQYDRILAAIFDCTLHSDKPVTIKLTCMAGEKRYESRSGTLRPGRNRIRLDLPALPQTRIVSIELTGAEQENELTFHRAWLDLDRDAAHSFCVRLESAEPFQIYAPGEPIALSLANRAGKVLPFELEGTLTSFSGVVVPFRKAGKVNPGERILIPLTERLPRFGHWTLRWQLHSGTTGASGETGLALLPELPEYHHRKGDFMFGICSHPSRWPVYDRQREARLARRLGANFVRTTVTWDVIQPKMDPDYFDYSLFDSVVEIFGAQGIAVQGMLVFTARYAAAEALRKNPDARVWSRSKPDLAAWRNYAEKTVARYRGKIPVWEIWNEPDLGFAGFSAADYVDIARVSHEAIRKVNPDAVIFSAGFAGLSPHPNRKDPNFQFKAMRDGKNYFDVHAYHGHARFLPFAEQIDRKLLPLRRAAGVTIPWYANETAVSAPPGMEREQAFTLFKKMIFCWSRGAVGYNWYDLRNDGLDPRNPEHTYGAVTFDFGAKPVASVYHTLARFFRGARYLRELPGLPQGCYGYLFEREGALLLAVWSESREFTGPIPVDLPADAAVEGIDCMGNEKALPLNGGGFLMEVSAEPMIYRVCGAEELKCREPLFSVAGSPVAAGREFQLAIAVVNPFPERVRFRFRLPATAGISFRPEAVETTLSPGERGTLELRGHAAAGSTSAIAAVSCEVPEISYRWNGTVPLRSATVIPAEARQSRRPADFKIDRPEQATSIGEGDPAMKERCWSGADDLSASVWLRKDADFLEFYVRSYDDLFVQREPVETLWKGDSIQIALLIPGQKGGWKIDLARMNRNRGKFISRHPEGLDAEKIAETILLTTHRDEKNKVTIYRAKLPFRSFGIDAGVLREGIRFNLQLNDNDGTLRESYMELYPGINAWENLHFFPLVVFE